MSLDQISNLKNRIFGKKGQGKQTELTGIMEMVRGFSCLGEIIGRDFEVKNPKGKVIYTIRQKPITLAQMNKLLKEFDVLMRLDAERENAKWGSKKGMPRARKR